MQHLVNKEEIRKILFISPQPFFTERGSPYRVLSTVSCLVSLGFKVDLLVFPLGREIEIPGVKIHRPDAKNSYKEIPIGPSWRKIHLDVLLALKARELSRKNSYYAVHGVEEAAFIASYIAKQQNAPYIVDMHSLLPEHLSDTKFIRSIFLNNVISKAYNRLLFMAGGIMTVADELTTYALNYSPTSNVLTIEDLPLDNLNTDNKSIEEIKQKYNLNKNTIITYTGNFKTYQGIDLLLESFAKFVKENSEIAKDVALLVVGGDTTEELSIYSKLVESLGIKGNVILTGARPAEEMGAFMRLSSALVSPRILGGNTPLKIYSYMAAMRPILATKISSHTQVLDDSTAFLRNSNVEDFSLVFTDFIKAEKSEVDTRIRNAKAIVDTKYNKQIFADKLAKLYSFSGIKNIRLAAN